MASDRDLNIGKAFEGTLCSTLARMSAPSPRQVSSIGLGSLAITDGSASPAAAGTSVGVAPTPSSVPASLSQHEAQPARPGLSPTLGRTTTVVEIGSDEDEDMGEGERVEADDEMEGGEDMPEDGGSKVSDTSLVARILAMSPIHIDEKGSPEIYVRGQNSNGYVHVAYYKEQARVKAEKEQKRGQTSDTVDNAPPPSAKKAKGARPSSSTSGQAGSPRTARDKNTLWNLFAAERDQWEVCSVEESCDRCRREIVTYGRKSWPCLRPVKPHNRGSRCASCTTGPCSFFPGNPARGFPPRSTDHSPLPPPINWGSPSSNPFMVQSTPATPSPSMRRRLPTANDDGFPSPVPLANLASSRPSPPTVGSSRPLLADEDIERLTCPPSPAVAGPSRPTPRRSPGSRPTATPSAADRKDMSALIEYNMRLVSALNALSTSIATVVNSSDVGPSSRTELARVSREQLTTMNDKQWRCLATIWEACLTYKKKTQGSLRQASTKLGKPCIVGSQSERRSDYKVR
ncbi:hypothetical protein TREMEDRAFT_60699 [Tremella mesenterica DSM 1558]|uniref:uncharacterized protein n=1 Tax=Tremella mesenterica (strain ATCC 24925 / CBS 8224 / DSM 1558 / NBRC 9311 / NRRL Y-6157 / RJB 2259-6 / UBC 559-6) TaxID=578456 RepID=UPI0003F49333|nr:uncharacterized protein TREMEDRAFT_60699 [Tremella mesenterica DSM 1558]EIW71784.1 hypothetical protein TREMEDRAFT_60699 [Tremella mesenterica DSM 1558]